jgi:hypothetical protein
MQQGQVWPYHGTALSAQRLAKGGFVFRPTRQYPDLVACVRCGGKLQGFKVTDDPEQDHAQYYPDCHLSQKKHDEEARLASFMQQSQVRPYHGAALSAEHLAKGGFVHREQPPPSPPWPPPPRERAPPRYTRDNLSDMEQCYFDGLKESKDPAKAQVVLDKIGQCHQGGISACGDIMAVVEGRVTLEELLRDQAEMKEIRRSQSERALLREAREVRGREVSGR